MRAHEKGIQERAAKHSALQARVDDLEGFSGKVVSVQSELEERVAQHSALLARVVHLEETAHVHLPEDNDIEESIYRGNRDLEEKVRVIESRGNVKVDGITGHVNLVRPLVFADRTTNDEPVAVFKEPDVASQTCKDLAELSTYFNAPIHIEGHTRGGTSQFWQTLAEDRARIVAELMVRNGADPNMITTAGLPGANGLNETQTVVYFDIPAITNPNELARLNERSKNNEFKER